jgi:hypothetical protein
LRRTTKSSTSSLQWPSRRSSKATRTLRPYPECGQSSGRLTFGVPDCGELATVAGVAVVGGETVRCGGRGPDLGPRAVAWVEVTLGVEASDGFLVEGDALGLGHDGAPSQSSPMARSSASCASSTPGRTRKRSRSSTRTRKRAPPSARRAKLGGRCAGCRGAADRRDSGRSVRRPSREARDYAWNGSGRRARRAGGASPGHCSSRSP